MLKGIDPLLTPDLLYMLRAMGHGDDLVIVDGNFPASSTNARVARVDGANATEVLAAVLSVMPLDSFVEHPCARMAVVGDPDQVPPVCAEFQTIIDQAEDGRYQLEVVERFAFYERAKQAYGLVQTSETRLYGNVLLKMGVIMPG